MHLADDDCVADVDGEIVDSVATSAEQRRHPDHPVKITDYPNGEPAEDGKVGLAEAEVYRWT